MNKRIVSVWMFLGGLSLLSCKDMSTKSHGPIVLGDSSTIVTEKDPMKLRDLVTDYKPDIPSSTENTDTVAKPQPKPDTTARTKTAATQTLPSVPGLKAEFSDVSVLIPNVHAKMSGRQNLQHANGAVYTLESGTINGNTITVTGNVTKVSQRYQTVAMLKSNIITMLVEPLSTTTSWEPLKGTGNQYRITGLDASSLESPEASANGIRNSVQRAAQRRRLSRRKIQELLSSIRHVRSVDQKPFTVVLRSVMWKIDGKDEKGRNFSKQIRVDMPL
jgi:hypothetical protein